MNHIRIRTRPADRLPVVHHCRAQFTIRSLMIAVVIVAGLLALPDELRGIAAVLSLPCLALFTAWRLLVGGHRRLAATCFWSLAIPVNVLCVALCASPGMLSLGLCHESTTPIGTNPSFGR